MKIWQVTTNDTQLRFYWYATKREADAHARKYKKENPGDTAEVEPCNFPAGRVGVVKAMNWVISMTCFNEG